MDEHQHDLASKFLALWDGYENRHIELSPLGVTRDEKRKINAKVTTVDGPVSLEAALAHLNHEGPSVGIAPVRADSTCSWGVLDIDWQEMPEDDVLELVKRMRTRCAAFRSKSLGLHIYVFTDQPVRAKLMHDYLVALRRRLPKKVQEKTEIFPKATQVVVTPDNEPTSVNLPLYGAQRELAWVLTDQHMGVIDEVDKSLILDMIENGCRVSASKVEEIAREQPTLDHSDMGYRVPDNPAGRNDLLMRIAASMQARGWPDTEMDVEIRRLNGDANFHHLFAEGPLSETEIVNLLKNAKRREKGAPTPLHFRVVEKFNRRWAKITINGVVEYLDKEAPEFTTFTKQMLFDETSDQVVRIGKSLLPIAQLWLRDPDHARYKGVVCEPIDYDGPGYNVWRGFQVSPKDGDASVFERYIRDVLCSGDEGLANWVTMWLADAVQRPTEPSPPTAIALRGNQGGGKSFLQQHILTPIFGKRYVVKVTESERLFSRFNRSIFGTTFIAAEESIFHGSQAVAAKLKAFISDSSWTYEEKFKATVQAKNVHRLIATTNEDQAVHIDFDDRRWTVIEVPQPFDLLTDEGKAQAYAFWQPFFDFVQSENGLGIILRYLLDYPVDRKELTFGYGTEAKASDKVASDPVIAVLHDIATTGIVPHDPTGDGILCSRTFADLVHRAGGRNMSPPEISKRLTKLLPYLQDEDRQVRNARYCERLHATTDMNGDLLVKPLFETRQRGFDLGKLEQFQDAVSRLTLKRYVGVELPEGYDPGDFGHSSKGWYAWAVPVDTDPNGPPPF